MVMSSERAFYDQIVFFYFRFKKHFVSMVLGQARFSGDGDPFFILEVITKRCFGSSPLFQC